MLETEKRLYLHRGCLHKVAPHMVFPRRHHREPGRSTRVSPSNVLLPKHVVGPGRITKADMVVPRRYIAECGSISPGETCESNTSLPEFTAMHEPDVKQKGKRGFKSDSDSVTCDVSGKTFETERNLQLHHSYVHRGIDIFLIAHDVAHVIEVMSYMDTPSDIAHTIVVTSYIDVLNVYSSA